MRDKDSPVPEDVTSQIERLAQGRGPFTDAEEAELRREEDVATPSLDDPQIRDDADAVRASILSRLEALEQSRMTPLAVPEPVLLPNQVIEHAKVVGAFTSGTTLTIDPVDVDGNDTGEANLSIYVKADRTSAIVAMADGAEVTWVRFNTAEDDGTVGVLVGTLLTEDELPEGGSQYMVLQRDGEGDAVWGWVRAH